MSKANGAVKNRAPAPIQISAEQILREAADRQEQHIVEPIVKIHDAEEYQSYLRDRRKHFEDNIRYRREHIGNWVKYARLEEDHKEYERARSIFERALEVDHRSAELWLRYAEFEMRNEFLNHARNVLDRAVQLLPRVDFLWYKYVYMEELVADIPKCRAVFERWMKWIPNDNAWLAYARFEVRNTTSIDRAEAVMRRYVQTYPTAKAFLKFAKWAEYEAKQTDLARTIYEAALSELEPEESKQARIFAQFAAFEERQGEYERCRVIYKHAIQLLHLEKQQEEKTKENDKMQEDDDDDVSEYEKQKRSELYKSYMNFEKKHGDRDGIETILLRKQRSQYEERVSNNPFDYDAWLEYATLEQEHCSNNKRNGTTTNGSNHDGLSNPSMVRDVFERAVAQIPPSSSSSSSTTTSSMSSHTQQQLQQSQTKKDHWRRYIYVWIYYALYEELTNHDLERASQIYDTCLSIIPHKQFTFSKIWIYSAKLYIRRHMLNKARKVFGRAIALCGKERIFEEYIALELALGEVDRCRAIYTNYVKAMPYNCKAWSKYASLEQSVGEVERCRAIYELALSSSDDHTMTGGVGLDMPEVLWKGYIDFEIDEGESDRARRLYERLLERTTHVKVWISYGQFEASSIGKGIEAARSIFQKAYDLLKEQELSDERVLLLDAWRAVEQQQPGDNQESIAAVEKKLPRRIKRKRMRKDEQGNDVGWEEYFDYQFPDDQGGSASSNLRILEMAAKWKQQQQQQGDDDDDSDDDGSGDDEDGDDDSGDEKDEMDVEARGS